jgi:hypothetical protein
MSNSIYILAVCLSFLISPICRGRINKIIKFTMVTVHTNPNSITVKFVSIDQGQIKLRLLSKFFNAYKAPIIIIHMYSIRYQIG